MPWSGSPSIQHAERERERERDLKATTMSLLHRHSNSQLLLAMIVAVRFGSRPSMATSPNDVTAVMVLIKTPSTE